MKVADVSAIIAAGTVALVFFLYWYSGRRKVRRVVLPQLGKADALYENGKIRRYRVRRHGVLLDILCEGPEPPRAGIALAESLSKDEIDRHLHQAVAAIPADQLKHWGFDKGAWRVEAITIRSDGSMGLDLGNSSDRDHVCLVSVERGEYAFEAVDG